MKTFFAYNKKLSIVILITASLFIITNFIHFCILYITNKLWWFDFYNLSNAITINILAAYILYIFVVYIPENKKYRLIKNNLSKQYNQFKETMISRFLNITNDNNEALATKLKDIKEFRAYFENNNQKRWYAILNGLDGNKYVLKDMLSELAILRNEISFTLNNIEIHDEQVFAFFKNLSQTIYKLEQSDFETDDFKSLMGFIWQLFSGWSWIDGYSEKDIIKSIIDRINDPAAGRPQGKASLI